MVGEGVKQNPDFVFHPPRRKKKLGIPKKKLGIS